MSVLCLKRRYGKDIIESYLNLRLLADCLDARDKEKPACGSSLVSVPPASSPLYEPFHQLLDLTRAGSDGINCLPRRRRFDASMSPMGYLTERLRVLCRRWSLSLSPAMAMSFTPNYTTNHHWGRRPC
nr:unnamed protein product [Spirometra erinaceieuropaei]